MAETVFANDMMRRWINFVRSQQQGAAEPTYEQRREEIARRRNPGCHYDTCTVCKKWLPCENGLLTMCDRCYAAWPGVDTDPPQTDGIARAVQNLSRKDNAFMPCAAEWGA